MMLLILAIVIVILSTGLIVYYMLNSKKEMLPPGAKILKSYRIETVDSDSISGGNSADLEGQLSYGAMFLPGRHDDWRDRVIREYEVAYIPKKEDCDLPVDFEKMYECPPYGLYAKCNPGGCASGTMCGNDQVCPGESGKCISGKCVCCQKGNSCKTNSTCGSGRCVSGKCDCSEFDMGYKCNVGMYPPHVNRTGSMSNVGAVKAPVDKSAYKESDWIPEGWWYSFPEGGECKKGQKLGDGCSWKSLKSSKSYTLGDLADTGFKFYCGKKTGSGCFPKNDVSSKQTENLKVLEKMFGVKKDVKKSLAMMRNQRQSGTERPSWQEAGVDMSTFQTSK